jgi:hypothetical protein
MYVCISILKHTLALSLLNIITVSVVSHVKVKFSPTVTLSDEFVSVKPGK